MEEEEEELAINGIDTEIICTTSKCRIHLEFIGSNWRATHRHIVIIISYCRRCAGLDSQPARGRLSSNGKIQASHTELTGQSFNLWTITLCDKIIYFIKDGPMDMGQAPEDVYVPTCELVYSILWPVTMRKQ